MKFSIITATYNSSASVADSVNSILKQSYDDYELIFIDGASKDGTVEILKRLTSELSQKVKLISEPDKGIYDALNKGISLATGDVIVFLHADDFFENETVLHHVAEVFKLNNVDSVYGDLVYVGKDSPQKIIRFWRSGEFQRNRIKSGWMPPHPALFVKRSIYQKYGSFDLGFKIAADYDFMMRILFKEQISTYYLPEVLVRMRVGGASNKSLKNILLKSREDLKAIKNNKIGGVTTLILKNFSKIPQFFLRR